MIKIDPIIAIKDVEHSSNWHEGTFAVLVAENGETALYEKKHKQIQIRQKKEYPLGSPLMDII